jgi:hypothetical protein
MRAQREMCKRDKGIVKGSWETLPNGRKTGLCAVCGQRVMVSPNFSVNQHRAPKASN